MRNFIKNIFKVSISNVISMFSGILVGFLVPKMMGLTGYANYKIYTLYFTYLALLSLGFGDGLYLRFSGMEKKELDKKLIGSYLYLYYIQLSIIFVLAIIFSIFIVPLEYRFISIALSVTIISSQVTAVHQNLSVLTSSFNEYTIRVITKAVLTAIFVIVLYSIYLYSKSVISYQIYVVGIVVIDFVLAGWYVYTYKEFYFLDKTSIKTNFSKYKGLLILGFPLLLSNMAGSIFLNLDRQFVSILFKREQYAIYAFAYNMLTLITTMTSAISLVLFPSLKKIKDLNVSEFLNKYIGIFNSIIAACLIVYFPLGMFIPYFLPKYIGSLEIFRIVLPGLVLSTTVSVILANFYKIEKKIKIYFFFTIIAMVVSIISNSIAYLLFKSYQSISWASIITLFIWYILELSFFIKKYHVPYINNTIYIILFLVAFYIITSMIKDLLLGAVLYIVFYLLIFIAFYKNAIIERIKNKRL